MICIYLYLCFECAACSYHDLATPFIAPFLCESLLLKSLSSTYIGRYTYRYPFQLTIGNLTECSVVSNGDSPSPAATSSFHSFTCMLILIFTIQFKQLMNKIDPFEIEDEGSDQENVPVPPPASHPEGGVQPQQEDVSKVL